MPRKVDLRIVIDTREKARDYLLPDYLIDNRRNKSGAKIVSIIEGTVRPKGVTKSTGDITLEYRFDGEKEWLKTSIAIEIKRSSDLFGTLYSNKKRFREELKRADEAGLDFWIIHDHDFTTHKKYVDSLMAKGLTRKGGFEAFGEAYLELVEEGRKIVVVSDSKKGTAIAIRRVLKRHWNKYRKNYIREVEKI